MLLGSLVAWTAFAKLLSSRRLRRTFSIFNFIIGLEHYEEPESSESCHSETTVKLC